MKPKPLLGAEDVLGEGDTRLVLDLLPDELRGDSIFARLREEVAWETMCHRGGEVPRLVAVQGAIEEDGRFPVYRHPSDQSPALRPFTPAVDLVRRHAESILGHSLNHALIQLYRGGKDYISEHSDKTIDVMHGTSIANVSFGARRIMVLRRKKSAALRGHRDGSNAISRGVPGPPRESQRIALPDNSMLLMGLRTNAAWLHAVHRDNRPDRAKAPEEAGERISLTFRCIGTFLSADGKDIFGQGARGKTREDARPVISVGEAEKAACRNEADELLEAFRRENCECDFDWQGNYGRGFDLLHFAANNG
ncbi:hypothetical protein HDZ31DRAFT_83932 [Schizophyllum fasciatum]